MADETPASPAPTPADVQAPAITSSPTDTARPAPEPTDAPKPTATNTPKPPTSIPKPPTATRTPTKVPTWTPTRTPTKAPVPLPAPTNLLIGGKTSYSLTLYWTVSADTRVTDIKFERAPSKSGPWTYVATVAKTERYFVDDGDVYPPGLPSGTTFCYRAAHVGPSGTSAWSKIACGSTRPASAACALVESR